MKNLTLSQAIEGFLLEKQAQRLSPYTVKDYTVAFRKLQAFLGDPVFASITLDQMRQFMADLGKPHQPGGIAPRPVMVLSKKTMLNVHTALSALWTWAVTEGLTKRHLLHEIPRPRPEKRAVTPLTEQDVKTLLGACDRSKPYDRPGKKTSDHGRATGLRDRAIILLLLDTGIRASELSEMQIQQVDIKNKRIRVMGKGSKERLLPISPTTAKALWRYLSTERKDEPVDQPLFLTLVGRAVTRTGLLQLLNSLGNRAGVPDCHPHRFRHTFAVNFLRNGGNAYELQMSLGHSTLEMVKTYLSLAEADLENAHKRASPVEKWRL